MQSGSLPPRLFVAHVVGRSDVMFQCLTQPQSTSQASKRKAHRPKPFQLASGDRNVILGAWHSNMSECDRDDAQQDVQQFKGAIKGTV